MMGSYQLQAIAIEVVVDSVHFFIWSLIMSRFIRRLRVSVVLPAVLCLYIFPSFVSADESPVKMVKLEGALDRTGSGPITPYTLSGVASHLGNFSAMGEVAFVPGLQPGSEKGSGVVVFFAANGDQLVGVVNWDITPPQNGTRESSIRFIWRDSVTLSNGTVLRNTGRFVTDRPPGLVVLGQTVCIRIPFTNKYICTVVLTR